MHELWQTHSGRCARVLGARLIAHTFNVNGTKVRRRFVAGVGLLSKKRSCFKWSLAKSLVQKPVRTTSAIRVAQAIQGTPEPVTCTAALCKVHPTLMAWHHVAMAVTRYNKPPSCSTFV